MNPLACTWEMSRAHLPRPFPCHLVLQSPVLLPLVFFPLPFNRYILSFFSFPSSSFVSCRGWFYQCTFVRWFSTTFKDAGPFVTHVRRLFFMAHNFYTSAFYEFRIAQMTCYEWIFARKIFCNVLVKNYLQKRIVHIFYKLIAPY